MTMSCMKQRAVDTSAKEVSPATKFTARSNRISYGKQQKKRKRENVPISLENPEYKGLELDVFSEKHGNGGERIVAFEGTYTGRRFLACAEPNLKFKNMKEKELLSEARMNLEMKNAEFTKFEEKLSQEKLELKFQVADLLKRKEKHNEEKYMLELKIVGLMKVE
ncbi:hypothetical protein ZWY2020_034864 [Hordeum vulgare]|nr:hypothetical protein ZWY2020_034864 [Hordeum vulgare]